MPLTAKEKKDGKDMLPAIVAQRNGNRYVQVPLTEISPVISVECHEYYDDVTESPGYIKYIYLRKDKTRYALQEHVGPLKHRDRDNDKWVEVEEP